jgi:polar amino acid transport system substrate-binding protein
MRTWKMWVSVLGVTALAGCGSSSSSSTTTKAAVTPPAASSSSTSTSTSSAPASVPTPAADPAVVALVPASIKSKGTLTVAADATYAPNEFIAPDGHTVIGMDADLVKALGAVMGLKATVSNVKFDAIIPGLSAGKYDMGASSFTDTKMREKTVDFIDYFIAGESFYTKAQGGTTINSIADLCGHSVAVETTTTEQTDAQTQSAKCKKAGKPAVTVLVLGDQNAANLAVASGRAQLGFADTPVAAYQVKKTNGQFKLVGQTFASAPYGLAVPKTSGLAKPVLAAVKALMKDGTYAQILTKWGVQAGAISSPKINGAIS